MSIFGLILRLLDLIKSIFDVHRAAKLRKINDNLAVTLKVGAEDDAALKASMDHIETLNVELQKAKDLIVHLSDTSKRKVELQNEIKTSNQRLAAFNDLLAQQR